MEETRLPAERELEGILGLEENAECHEEENEETAGMGCSCKNIDPLFLQAVEEYFTGPGGRTSRLGPEEEAYLAKLGVLAKGCGFEKDGKGDWVLFPRREAILEKLGPYTVIKEHDDGDLTLSTAEGKVVVTTEGEVFYERK